ncbi:MAG: peptide chain release factor 1 [Calditrichaeota bacterium]|nr:MAG: peptide chain release factor 1 [Calditrichota bacterium]
MIDKIEKIFERRKALEEMLNDPNIFSDRKKSEETGREYRELDSVIPKCNEYLEVHGQIMDDKEVIEAGDDPELKEFAKEELSELEPKLKEIEEELRLLLVPKDPMDSKNAILEIRAGAGGDEAAIFAGDLFRMYSRYVENSSFKLEEISSSEFGVGGGLKEIICLVKGEGAYGTLKFESGVHRVQRVPKTESQGRVHTSAASVAVLPEIEEFDVQLNQNDVRVDTFCSSGPGGQSVNTTYSAVRLTHEPTGIVVTCQDEKSQIKNKAKAMKVLASRIYDVKKAEEEAKIAQERKLQVGTGDRSAKIRTYNYPQGRVTDHRINLTLYKLDAVVDGEITEFIDSLKVADRMEKLQ